MEKYGTFILSATNLVLNSSTSRFGRDGYQEAMKVAYRLEQVKVDWAKFSYMVFDMPNQPGPYKERYERLCNASYPNVNFFYLIFRTARMLGEGKSKYIQLAPKQICQNTTHLEAFFQDIIDGGGEGIILRDPLSPYIPGRSAGYLKHKKFRDAEAKIVRAVGNHQWECELYVSQTRCWYHLSAYSLRPNQVRFVAPAGTTEFARRWQPKEGDIVSFKHHGFLPTTRKPKLPTIYRMRNDLNWDQVMSNWKEHVFKPTGNTLDYMKYFKTITNTSIISLAYQKGKIAEG